MAISMSRDQYELLLQYAEGTRTSDTVLTDLKKKIDTANGVKRFFLLIRWMESGGAPPTRIEIGLGWPPTQQFELRMDRAISRDDVDIVLRTQATRPVSPVVTTDPGGTLGWTELDAWDFDTNA
jgi:hypothetical protein